MLIPGSINNGTLQPSAPTNIVFFLSSLGNYDSALNAVAMAIAYGVDNSGSQTNYTINQATVTTSLNVYNWINARCLFNTGEFDPVYCLLHGSRLAVINATGYMGSVSGYPQVQFVSPLGSNSHIQLTFSPDTESNVITTGSSTVASGSTSNGTGYGNAVSFFDTFNNQSSQSAGMVAGKLLYIKEQRSITAGYETTWWDARYSAMQTADNNSSFSSHDLNNGWGKINIINAIAYSGSIPSDPYPQT